MKKRIIGLFAFVLVCAVALVGIYKYCSVEIKGGKACDCYRYSAADSTLLDDRHMGYINLHKFLKLASTDISFDSISDFKRENDTIVSFTVKSLVMFYGADYGNYWKNNFKNMPICITDSGFTARVRDIDSVEYVYLPYQILASVAGYIREPEAAATGRSKPGSLLDSTITITNRENLPEENSSVGKKIQTGGFVFKNVSDILAKYGQNCNGNNYEQMKVLWSYVKNHWNYITDPYDKNDTWRSAYETIENYYFVAGSCYSGDCDDFAILMASFARQIGFRSHLVTAFNNSGGHAYAEFFDEQTGRWVPLDWFGDFGKDKFNGTVYRIYEDL